MNQTPIFLISLDFELHWGSFDKHPLTPERKQYYLNTREAVKEMLRLFKKYEVRATWATVGLLFFEDKEELLSHLPQNRPDYINRQLSAYHYINNGNIGKNEQVDPFHYASSLLDIIASTPHQEIATHTFSHYYCNEPGQTADTFREDLSTAIKTGQGKGQNIKSLVFARNQFNKEYLEVCNKLGITSVRTNPDVWWWHIDSTQQESRWKRFNRGLDAYIKLDRKTTFKLSDLDPELPLRIPASRLLRPWSTKYKFLNNRRIKRILNEMTSAAKNNEAYHLWWHPHNFGTHPEENLKDLEEILKHYKLLYDHYGMRSMNMGEVAEMIMNESKVH